MRIIKSAALALAVPGMLAVTVPAGAVPSQFAASAANGHEQSWEHNRNRRDRYYDEGRYGRRSYDERAYAGQNWRGNDGRTYCRKKDGTVGLIVGGAAGALLGREVAGRGDRTLGAILGGAGGALLGREVDRNGSRCR